MLRLCSCGGILLFFILFAQILLFVLLSGHFPFNTMPAEQTDLDRIIENSVGERAKVRDLLLQAMHLLLVAMHLFLVASCYY